MKRSMRLLAAMFFIAAMSSSSFAYRLLCQTGPITKVATSTVQTIYSCAIPANAVATNKSIRVTMNLVADGQFWCGLVLNGANTYQPFTTPTGSNHWDMIIVNTGSTTGSLGGLLPENNTQGTVGALAAQSVSPATLPWASGWTLAFTVLSPTTTTMYGATFTVEILS